MSNGIITIPASVIQRTSAGASSAPKETPKRSNQPRLKVVVRRLPPGLTQGEFEEAVGPDWTNGSEKVDWYSYRPGRSTTDPTEHSQPSRAYLQLASTSLIEEFSKVIEGTKFTDARKTFNDPILLGPPMVEHAPYHRTPRSASSRRKKDPRQGQIDQDTEFIAFLESLTDPIHKGLTDLEGSLQKEGGDKGLKATPLLAHMREKKTAKDRGPNIRIVPKGRADAAADPSGAGASGGSFKDKKGKGKETGSSDTKSRKQLKAEKAERAALAAANQAAPPQTASATAATSSTASAANATTPTTGNGSLNVKVLGRSDPSSAASQAATSSPTTAPTGSSHAGSSNVQVKAATPASAGTVTPAGRRRDRAAAQAVQVAAAKIQRDLGLAGGGRRASRRERAAAAGAAAAAASSSQSSPANNADPDSAKSSAAGAEPAKTTGDAVAASASQGPHEERHISSTPSAPRNAKRETRSRNKQPATQSSPPKPRVPSSAPNTTPALTVLKKQPPPLQHVAAQTSPAGKAPLNAPAAPKALASPPPTVPATNGPASPLPLAANKRAFLKHANPSQGVTEALIHTALSTYGSVASVEIDKRKGFAYVDFETREGLLSAVRAGKVPVAQGAVQVLEFKERAPAPAVGPVSGKGGVSGRGEAVHRGGRGAMASGGRGAFRGRGRGRGGAAPAQTPVVGATGT